MDKYKQTIESHDDLEDTLSTLSEHLHEFTGSTGVYIGHLEKPKLEIEEDADEKAHIDDDAVEEVKWIEAHPNNHDFLKNQIVKQDEGVIHQLWGIKRALEGEEEEAE